MNNTDEPIFYFFFAVFYVLIILNATCIYSSYKDIKANKYAT